MIKAIMVHDKDNVATAVQEIQSGEEVEVQGKKVKVLEKVPFGHKFAVGEIAKGDDIVKYGEVMGEATENIGYGNYVHTHNVMSKRGRGDLKGAM